MPTSEIIVMNTIPTAKITGIDAIPINKIVDTIATKPNRARYNTDEQKQLSIFNTIPINEKKY